MKILTRAREWLADQRAGVGAAIGGVAIVGTVIGAVLLGVVSYDTNSTPNESTFQAQVALDNAAVDLYTAAQYDSSVSAAVHGSHTLSWSVPSPMVTPGASPAPITLNAAFGSGNTVVLTTTAAGVTIGLPVPVKARGVPPGTTKQIR